MMKYDGSKHYMDKPTLDDLDDRDWRIFREDYEIVTRVDAPPGDGEADPAFRYWKESGLNDEILRDRKRGTSGRRACRCSASRSASRART